MIITSRICIIALVCSVLTYTQSARKTVLRNNGYENVVIAIHDSVPQDMHLIERIKKLFTETSGELFKATRKRAYFRYITILLPRTWPDNSKYEQETGESFQTADIRIDPRQNPTLPAHNPYVQGIGRCQPGRFMHLTPKYIKDEDFAINNWGQYPKTLVHEWAHLRWGAKDEYPTDPRNTFYVDSRGIIQGTRCSLTASGRVQIFDPATHRYRSCRIDPNTGVYEYGCRFMSDYKNSKNRASIMFRHFIPTVTSFCDSNPSDVFGYHNSEAPNRQNIQCGGRSVWEVIRSHPDFSAGINGPTSTRINTAPHFRLVRKRTRKFVIMADTSGSMEGKLLRQLQQACSHFIATAIEDGDYVGIGHFAYNAFQLSPMVNITSQEVRWDVIRKLPAVAEGGTSIGAGLNVGLYILSRGHTIDPSGGKIILISDGEENTTPHISSVIDNIIKSEVTVDTIGLTSSADGQLGNLAEKTHGSAYFSSGDTMNGLESAFSAIGAKDRRDPLITVQSEVALLDPYANYTTKFHIDSSANKDTFTLIAWTVPALDVKVTFTSPSGLTVISEASSEYYFDWVERNNVYIKLKRPEQGLWKLTVENKGNVSHTVTITTKASADHGSDIIEITPNLQRYDISYREQTFVEIHASIHKGYMGIVHANVTAVIEFQNGQMFYVTMKDNGQGADEIKDDGSYSAYFANFSHGNGRYSVVIVATDNDHQAEYNMQPSGYGSPLMNTELENLKTVQENIPIKDSFHRIQAAGSFSLRHYDNKGDNLDILPPTRISDLEVVQLSYENQTVTLFWTAPGGDLDMDAVHEYDLRYGRTFIDLYNLNTSQTISNVNCFTSHNASMPDTFENSTECHGDSVYVIKGNLRNPKSSGNKEFVTIKLPQRGERVIYTFAIRGRDSWGNVGDVSNIVSANLQYIPPLHEQIVKDVEAVVPSGDRLDNVGVIEGIVAGSVVFIVIVVAMVIGIAVVKLRKRNISTEQSSA